jgi:hypothetical protein
MTHPPTLAQSAAAAGTAPHERRASVRQACDLEGLSHPLDQSDAICWGATVQDVSLGGLGLLVCYPFKPGTLLAVELRTARGAPRTVLARVVHAHDQADGSWVVGCEFSRRLSADELNELL